MFGEIEYDLIRQYCLMFIEEQFDVFGRVVDVGKVNVLVQFFFKVLGNRYVQLSYIY